MELFDLGKALQAQLYGSRADLDHHPLFEENPNLLNRLVSKLAYCVRDASPRYIAVDMSGAADQGSFNIALYTDDHLLHLSYDQTVDHITTTVVGRESVRMLEVLSAPNFMAGDTPGTYQGTVRMAVSYDELKVQLPGDNEATEQNREQLDAFMPSLLRDLARK